MGELSDGGAIDGWNRGNPARRCTAHRKNGDRCKRWAIRGGTVCTHHGGNTPAVKAKARRRLEEAADRLAKQLLGIAETAESEQVRLAAIRDALDRAGLKPTTQVDVAVGPQPWEGLVAGLAPMSRAESRAARGVPDVVTPQRALRVGEPEIVDAEVVDPPSSDANEMPTAGQGSGSSEPAQPGTGLMTMEEANAIARQRHSG